MRRNKEVFEMISVFLTFNLSLIRAPSIKQWTMWFSLLKICSVLWMKLRHQPSVMASRSSNALSTFLEHVLQRSENIQCEVFMHCNKVVADTDNPVRILML